MTKKHVRKLTVTGNAGTYFVTLPKEIIRDLNWRKGQKVVVEQKGEEIGIKDWEKTDR